MNKDVRRDDLGIETIGAFMSGEEWAFSEVYERYRKPLLKQIIDRVRNVEVAKELLQEVFLKVHRFRGSYSPKYALSTWLWTISRNTVLDWRKRLEVVAERDSAVEEVSCPLPSTEAMIDMKLERRHLRKFFARLTSQQRRVLWLRVVHQLSYEEISSRLGLSLSAVKCLVYRAKQMMSDLARAPAYT